MLTKTSFEKISSNYRFWQSLIDKPLSLKCSMVRIEFSNKNFRPSQTKSFLPNSFFHFLKIWSVTLIGNCLQTDFVHFLLQGLEIGLPRGGLSVNAVVVRGSNASQGSFNQRTIKMPFTNNVTSIEVAD